MRFMAITYLGVTDTAAAAGCICILSVVFITVMSFVFAISREE